MSPFDPPPPCGQLPVENSGQPVDKSGNPARKILDAMPLTSKPVIKSRTDSQSTGLREVVHNLAESIHNVDQSVGAILDAIDLIKARIDALETGQKRP